MICSFNLLSTSIPDAATGGVWTQIGYSADGASYGSGGTALSLFGDNPSIDPSDIIAGYYKLVYDDGCNSPQQVILKVNQKLSAGESKGLTYCINDNIVVNLFDAIDYESPGGTWTVSPNGLQPPPGSYSLSAGTLTLSQLTTPGNYIFLYSIVATVTAGFNQIPCVGCSGIVEAVITVTPEFFAGTSNTITVSDTAGSFALYDNLIGISDSSGSWVQTSGSPAAITGGYLGTVNLNSLSGCLFVFKYSGGAGNCYAESFVTVNKVVSYSTNITYAGGILTANHSACGTGMTYQWYNLIGLNYVLLVGATSQTYTTSVVGQYKVIVSCNGCFQEAFYTIPALVCSNTACFDITYQNVGGVPQYLVSPNGTQASAVATNVYQWKVNGGTYATFNPATPLIGCQISEFLNVTPFCQVAGSKIRVGYSGFTSCPTRTIDALSVEYGNGSQTNFGGFLGNQDVEWTPAEWITRGRTATFRISMNTPAGGLVKYVTFTYTGTTNVTCTEMTISEAASPILFYRIYVKRTVTFSDGCPSVGCETFYQQDLGCSIDVYLSLANVSNPPIYTGAAISSSVVNCQQAFTRVWKLNGTVLAGETGSYVPVTYGTGVYEVIITCGSCVRSDTIIYQPGCTIAVTITTGAGTATANVSGCATATTYQWAYRLDGSSSWINLGTTQTQATTILGATYRVIATCGGCTAQATTYVSNPCSTLDSSISSVGTLMTVAVTGCSGSPTYQWRYQSGLTWVNLGTSATQTATQGGALYDVTVTCGSCTSNSTLQFVPTCTATVAITSNGAPLPLLTATTTGCTGGVTYLWERLSGTTWVSAGTAQTLSPTIQALYRVTITCGGCTATAQYNYTACTATVAINIATNVLTANASNCGGAVSYLWEMSINGGTSFSTVATTQQITVSQTAIYKVTVTCGGCTATAQTSYTSPCTSNVTLTYNAGANLLTAVNTGCGSVIYVWQFSPNYNPTSQGCTGWTQVASGVTTYAPTQTGCYRVATFCGTFGACPSEATVYVVLANPCTGLSLPVTTGIGVLNFDRLYNNGIAVTNYLISWVNSSNVEVFRSAAGTFYNAATTYPHPSNNIPIASGLYSAIILNSDVGNNLDCFSDINVPTVQCSDNYELNYNGAGGAAATTNATISVNATTGHLKIFIQTFAVADTLSVIYNGSTIFTSGAISTYAGLSFIVPITYVSGQNSATVRVTNSTPASNTQYRIKIRCCQTETTCPIPLNPITFNSAALNDSYCGCDINLNFNYGNLEVAYNSLCKTISEYFRNYGSQYGGCSNTVLSTFYACVASAITIIKGSGARFTFSFPVGQNAEYLALKAAIIATTNPNQYIMIIIKSNSCPSDGGYEILNIYPSYSTIVYTDATRSINVTMPAVNPYADSCTNCTRLLNTAWAGTYDTVDNAGSYLYGTTWVSYFGYDVRTASAISITPTDFVERIVTSCGTVEKKYRISFRSFDCPCQSWQVFEDADNNGSYETLRLEASGWTGACV